MNAETTQTGEGVHIRPSLLIADDDTVVRTALSYLLRDDFDVVAVAGDATEAIELAEKHRPAVALIDVEMPGGGAREAVPQISSRAPATRMVILSGDESRTVVGELLNAGAIAYMRKGATRAEISKTLTAALGVDAPQFQTWTVSR